MAKFKLIEKLNIIESKILTVGTVCSLLEGGRPTGFVSQGREAVRCCILAADSAADCADDCVDDCADDCADDCDCVFQKVGLVDYHPHVRDYSSHLAQPHRRRPSLLSEFQPGNER